MNSIACAWKVARSAIAVDRSRRLAARTGAVSGVAALHEHPADDDDQRHPCPEVETGFDAREEVTLLAGEREPQAGLERQPPHAISPEPGDDRLHDDRRDEDHRDGDRRLPDGRTETEAEHREEAAQDDLPGETGEVLVRVVEPHGDVTAVED